MKGGENCCYYTAQLPCRDDGNLALLWISEFFIFVALHGPNFPLVYLGRD